MQAHDPAVKNLPEQLGAVMLYASAVEAAQGADALVVATEWPDYRAVAMPEVLKGMRSMIVLDANRFLAAALETLPNVNYVAVGKAIKL